VRIHKRFSPKPTQGFGASRGRWDRPRGCGCLPQGKPVALGVIRIDAAPITAHVPRERRHEVKRTVLGMQRARYGNHATEREERGSCRATSAPSVLPAAFGGIRTMRPLTGSAFSSTFRPPPWLCCHTDPIRVQQEQFAAHRAGGWVRVAGTASAEVPRPPDVPKAASGRGCLSTAKPESQHPV
jgi:hypothetical protein